MSGRVFLFFPPRGHEPPPTLRDRLNPNLSLLTPLFSNPPLCQTPGCRSVHSRSTLYPSHPVLSALRPQGFSTRVWFSSLIIPDVCMVFDYGKPVYTTVVLLLLCCRRALILLSAPVILMMKQLPSHTPETMQQRAFAMCCTRCTCPCLHAWVVFHRL